MRVQDSVVLGICAACVVAIMFLTVPAIGAAEYSIAGGGSHRPVIGIRRIGEQLVDIRIYDLQGNVMVNISGVDGTVTLTQPGKDKEAARRFWQAVASVSKIYLPCPDEKDSLRVER